MSKRLAVSLSWGAILFAGGLGAGRASVDLLARAVDLREVPRQPMFVAPEPMGTGLFEPTGDGRYDVRVNHCNLHFVTPVPTASARP